MGESKESGGEKSLPREVFKWLQGLDLAYSIKNIRRDFSNGFLVAEIFSRYFPMHMEMHSYHNGTSETYKKSNWKLLSKMFSKIGFVFPDDAKLIEGVMNSDVRKVVIFLNMTYSFLTARKICLAKAPKLAASSKSRERKPGQIAGDQSIQSQGSNVETLPSRLDDSSINTQSKFEPLSSTATRTPSKVLRGEPRRLVMASDLHVQAGAISIKDLDSNIMKLRATRNPEMSMIQSLTMDEGKEDAPLTEGDNNGEGEEEEKDNLTGERALQATTPLGVLEETLIGALGRKSGFTVATFLCELTDTEGAQDSSLGDQDLARVLQTLEIYLDHLAVCALAEPMEWRKLGTALSAAFVRRNQRDAGRILAHVGQLVAETSHSIAHSMFFDSCMLELKKVLLDSRHQPQAEALAIFAAFCPVDSATHVRALHELGQRLGNIKAFTRCIVTLLDLVGDDLVLSGSNPLSRYLKDISIRYLINSSTTVRANCLTIAAKVTKDLLNEKKTPERETKLDLVDADAVMAAFLSHTNLAKNEEWWEVRVCTIQLLCTILDFEGHDEYVTNSAIEVLETMLRDPKRNSQQVLSIACSCIAPLLDSYCELMPAFISAMLSLDIHSRHQILNTESFQPEIQTNALTGQAFRSVSSSWAPLVIMGYWESGNYKFGKILKPNETELYLALVASWCETASEVDIELGLPVNAAMFEVVSSPLLRALDSAKKDREFCTTIAKLVELLACACNVNVFVHPMWPDVLYRLYSVDKDHPISTALRQALVCNDDNIVAATTVMIEETMAKYPQLNLGHFLKTNRSHK